MSKIKCDVLVVGGGISGLTSALNLSKKGLDVVIAERKLELGSNKKYDIAEDMGLEKIINKLKLPVEARTNRGDWYTQNQNISFKSNVDDLYFKRGSEEDCFESIVSERLMALNVDILLGCNRIKLDEERATIRRGNKDIQVNTKIIVGADGAQSIVREQFKQEVRNLAAFEAYGFFGEDLKIEGGKTCVVFDSKLFPGGYFYAGVVNGEGIACAVFEMGEMKLSAKDYFKIAKRNSRIARLIGPFKEINSFYGRGYSIEVRNRVYNNMVLIGEAGGLLDPVFGYGVRNAIISGYKASESIYEALKEDNMELLNEYEKYSSNLSDVIKKNAPIRAVLNSFTNEDWDKLFQTLIKYKKSGGNINDVLDGNFNMKLITALFKSPRLFFRLLSKYGVERTKLTF
jgi:flavin-dependent dehydrogenase